MTSSTPSKMLTELGDLASSRLNDATTVVDTVPPIDSADLYSGAASWRKYKGVVAVFTDLKGSTKLAADGMWNKSTASIYNAAIEPMARIFDSFESDYISIQGDGGFGLFTGELAVERAVCAAVSIQTFSINKLSPLIKARWADVKNPPVTGFKTGVAISHLLGRKVGIARTDHKAPVWAGRAVNYAAKASQQANAHQTVITGPIFDVVSKNDYLTFSCGCNAELVARLWQPTTIAHVGSNDADGQSLNSSWCTIHGDEFCEAVLAGERRREDENVKSARAQLTRERLAS